MDELIQRSDVAWRQDRCGQRVREHLLGQLVGLGRHTLSGLLCTTGHAFGDWSAHYRLYSRQRVDPEPLFRTARSGVESFLSADQPLVIGLDDSILRKRGRKIPGVGWRRDPLGPPFSLNWVLAQRVVQFSAALPCGPDGAARMIPIDFVHAPTAVKPKKKASPDEWSAYREVARQRNINRVAVERLALLLSGSSSRPLWLTVDGRFTNSTVFKGLPQSVTLIGRIRGDARLYRPPQAVAVPRGRPQNYGDALPTPEQIRQEDSIPWQNIAAFAAGKKHKFRLKTIDSVRWRTVGAKDVRLIVIAPLGYRLRKGGRMLYRKPAYLICTNPNLSLAQVLQAYLWRWDIEVNFRDEKTLLGVGQAQVRHPNSVESVPALTVAAYALLLLAAAQTYGPQGMPDTLPRPAWRKNQPRSRATTMDLIQQLRWDLWAHGLRSTTFSGFSSTSVPDHKPQKLSDALDSALFLAIPA